MKRVICLVAFDCYDDRVAEAPVGHMEEYLPDFLQASVGHVMTLPIPIDEACPECGTEGGETVELFRTDLRGDYPIDPAPDAEDNVLACTDCGQVFLYRREV